MRRPGDQARLVGHPDLVATILRLSRYDNGTYEVFWLDANLRPASAWLPEGALHEEVPAHG